MSWFRMYDSVADDPKVQRLPGDLFKAWVNILAIASRTAGILPTLDDLAFALRTSKQATQKIVSQLVSAELLDETEFGFEPHNWGNRQHKNDVSTERVQRFRKRQKEREEKRDETVSRNGKETKNETGSPSAPARVHMIATEQSRNRTDSSAAESEGDASQRSRPPDDLAKLEAKLREASGVGSAPHPGLLMLSPILGLLQAGYDLEADILPTLRAKAAGGHFGRSWKFYVEAIKDAHADRETVAAVPKPNGHAIAPSILPADEARWRSRFAELRSGSSWHSQWGPRIGAPDCLAPRDLVEQHVAWCRERNIEVAA